jgi:phytoene dehydrogenase-like protein
VGAGAAGLSAAWRLRAAGLENFLVLELDDAPGGTARSGQSSVSAFPWGAHYLPAPLDAQGPVPRLLREMGALTSVDDAGVPQFAEQMLVRDPQERLFYRGHWYEGLYLRVGASHQDSAELARFEARMNQFASLVDARGRRAFDVPIERGSDDADITALDRLSMAQWLEQEGFKSARLRWYVDYACRDDFGAMADQVSAYAAIWYFASRHDGRGRPRETEG